MALFKLGAFAEYLTGKAGNTVFARTKSGTVARDFVIPTNPNTDAQQFVRNNLTDSSTTWRTMSAIRVKAWNQYAKNIKRRSRGGQLRSMNGINAFTALTTKFLQVNPNGVIPMDPPVAPFKGDPISLSATAGVGEIEFTSDGDNSNNVKTEILLQPLASANRKPQKGAYISHGFFSMDAGDPVSVPVPTGHYAAAYRFVNTQTGQDTGMRFLPVLTVAISISTPQKTKKAA